MEFILKGILIGLIFGVPVGAVGAISSKRTLTDGKKAGILSGLGSSVADCIYASIGAFGLTFISNWLLKYQTIINIIGGLIIAVMGINMILKKDAKTITDDEIKTKNIAKMFLSSFVIGITNPTAILTFIFSFSYFGMNNIQTFEALKLVIGVFCGTFIWWIILALITSKFKNKLGKNGFKKLNIIFGIILILFSIAIFVKTLLN